MIQANQYLFTSFPSAAIIHGGPAANAMCLTHEHLMYINEAVRTLEYAGSISPGRYGASYSGATSKDSPGAMAFSLGDLDNYVSRAAAVFNIPVTNSTPTDGRGLWLKSSDQGRTEGKPAITESQVRQRLVFSTRDVYRPSGLAPMRQLVKEFLTDYNGGVCSRCQNAVQVGRNRRCSILELNASGDLGGLYHYFYERDSDWTCNGSSSPPPESSQTFLAPFGTEIGFAASTYFREVSEDSDLTFSREAEYGYDLPAALWPLPSGSNARCEFSVVWCFTCTSLWINNAEQKTYGRERMTAFLLDPNAFAVEGNDTRVWGITSDGSIDSIRGRVEKCLEYMRRDDIFDRGEQFHPETFVSEPDAEMPETFRRVGYQLYAWPTVMVANAIPHRRDMGETI